MRQSNDQWGERMAFSVNDFNDLLQLPKSKGMLNFGVDLAYTAEAQREELKPLCALGVSAVHVSSSHRRGAERGAEASLRPRRLCGARFLQHLQVAR